MVEFWVDLGEEKEVICWVLEADFRWKGRRRKVAEFQWGRRRRMGAGGSGFSRSLWTIQGERRRSGAEALTGAGGGVKRGGF